MMHDMSAMMWGMGLLNIIIILMLLLVVAALIKYLFYR
jgi:hypothetical protein